MTTEGKLVYSLPARTSNPSAPSWHLPYALGEASRVAPESGLSPLRSRGDVGAADRGVVSLANTPDKAITAAPRPWSLTESFVTATGEKLSATPQGYRPAEATVSYFTGNDVTKHQPRVNTYDRVNLGDVFTGINVQLRATGSNVEKIFTVAPQHDPKQIHVKLEGATSLAIGTQGELIAHTGNGPVAFTAPIAFQETAAGERTPVPVAFALDASQHRYGFTLGEYDLSRPLVIDPLLASTYLGGTGLE